MLATSMFAEIPTAVNVLARLNVAVSAAPLGNPVLGVQSELVFQSEPVSFHDALPAKMTPCVETKSRATIARNNDVCAFLRSTRFDFICLSSIGARPRQNPQTWMLGSFTHGCQGIKVVRPIK